MSDDNYKIVAATSWWAVDRCNNCNNEYDHHEIYEKINCSNCGKICERKILAPHYAVGKRKVWTVKHPWWMIWKWHMNKSHFEYHGLRQMKNSNVRNEEK